MADQLLSLPDVLLFRIVTFTACPTHRAEVVCHQLAPLSQRFAERAKSNHLWEQLLQEDYGSAVASRRSNRCSKRLRRSALFRVKEAHQLIKDNTEIAYFYLSEMTSSSNKKKQLTRASFRRLLDEYGPHLRYNQTLSTGGRFLVEVCRAKQTRGEHVILQCVQELIERRGALVNVATSESVHQSITALAVAAARGMPKVVQYLLEAGADASIRSSGRFQLHSNPRKSMGLREAVPSEFCQAMIDEELRHDPAANLSSLLNCLALLSDYENKTTIALA